VAQGDARIQLCGRLVVQVGARRIEDALPGSGGRLLFAYLVLNRLRRIGRDELLIASTATRPRRTTNVV
jgi:SARP family transcriptional regulator, regulator of embCAB operon